MRSLFSLFKSNSIPFLRVCIATVLISLLSLKLSLAADLVIRIPGNLSQDNSSYRLAYSPPHGVPPPNTTIPSRDIGDVIQFSKGLPGTKYDFWLYYSNSTLHDWLTWTASITTAPDPAANLSINVRGGKTAIVSWNPPAVGSYSGFKMRVVSYLDKPPPPPRLINLTENASPYTLRDLTPGGSYQIQLYTVYDNKESVAYISRNFTTKPNTPGKFIVWFRNETTLLVLWQPSYPASIYTHYKVSIDPPDAQESVLYVEKEGEPPGPAQAAFKGLIPGRAYNISVQTVSEDETSTPTTAQYRTIPLRPLTLNYDKASITHNSFKVHWEPPKEFSETDAAHTLGTPDLNDKEIIEEITESDNNVIEEAKGRKFSTFSCYGATLAGNTLMRLCKMRNCNLKEFLMLEQIIEQIMIDCLPEKQ